MTRPCYRKDHPGTIPKPARGDARCLKDEEQKAMMEEAGALIEDLADGCDDPDPQLASILRILATGLTLPMAVQILAQAT